MKNQQQANNPKNSDHLPNPVMLSRQIDGLREVMRRMRTAQTDTVDLLINKKLEQIAQM